MVHALSAIRIPNISLIAELNELGTDARMQNKAPRLTRIAWITKYEL